MSIADAFIATDAEYKASVLAATWGHFESKANIIHRGKVIFAVTDYNEHTIIEHTFSFEGGPGFYSHITDVIYKISQDYKLDTGVYVLEACCRRYKSSGYRTSGTLHHYYLNHKSSLRIKNRGKVWSSRSLRKRT